MSSLVTALTALLVSTVPTLPVLVVDPGDDAQETSHVAVLQAVQAQLKDLRVQLNLETVRAVPPEGLLAASAGAARGTNVLGVVWIDLRNDFVLTLVDPQGSRALVRRIRVGPGGRAAALEEMTVALRALITGLLEGGQIAREPVVLAPAAPPPSVKPEAPVVPEPAPAPGPAPAPVPPAAPWLGLSLGYTGEAVAPQAPWQSGAHVAARTDFGWPWSLGVGYTAAAPIEVGSPSAFISVARHPIDVFAELHWERGRWRLGGEAAFVLDDVARRTVLAASGVSAAPDGDRLLIGAGLRARVELAVAARVRIFVAPGLSAFFNNTDYVAETFAPALPALPPTMTTQTLLSPRTVRFGFELGLCVGI